MLILVRHGQTHSNAAKIIDTRPPGAELTDVGRAQATNLGAELAEYDLNSINCSKGHFAELHHSRSGGK